MKKLLTTVAAILAIALLTGCPGSPKDNENTGGNSGSNSGSGNGSGNGANDSGGGGAVTQKTIKAAPDAVGDIVLKNGKAIAYYDGLTLTDQEKADAIAVIFYAGGDNELGNRKLGVGLKEFVDMRSYYAQGSNTQGKKLNDANDELNGLNNQNTMEDYDDFNSSNDSDNKYPAFYWAYNYYEEISVLWGDESGFGQNWYVPATKELKKLLEQSAIMNKAFAKISDTADKFPETGSKSYWSSTTDNTPTNEITL